LKACSSFLSGSRSLVGFQPPSQIFLATYKHKGGDVFVSEYTRVSVTQQGDLNSTHCTYCGALQIGTSGCPNSVSR
jgi:hypothetical protein